MAPSAMMIKENISLAPLTTLCIGGPARYFARAQSEADIVEAVQFARKQKIPVFVLGGGSNLLVSDAGYNGLVLQIALRGITQQDGLFQSAAGEEWESFVQRAVEGNYAGIECLAGIPGTVGGTPVQNVGAYGQEVASSIELVRAFDLSTLLFHEFTNTKCKFGYRSSRFNSEDRGRFIITRVDYRLKQNGDPALNYADLKKIFPLGSHPTLAEVTAEVRKIRHAKGMLLVEGEIDSRSAGSFFKNPILSIDQFEKISGSSPNPPPSYPAGTGQVKIPAAWLIEHSGFAKGYTLGNAAISSSHTLALTNRGNATAAEIIALRDKITTAVHQKFGVQLEMEPVQLGF
jgi:UDP-N-acetylmuramate dehydrogenase